MGKPKRDEVGTTQVHNTVTTKTENSIGRRRGAAKRRTPYLKLDISHRGTFNAVTSKRITSARKRVNDLKAVGVLGRVHPPTSVKDAKNFEQPLFEYGLVVTPITTAQAEASYDMIREELALTVKLKRAETVRRAFAIVGLYDTETRREIQARNLRNRLERLMDEEGQYESAWERWIAQSEINALTHEYKENELNEMEQVMIDRWKRREAKILKRKINIGRNANRHPLLLIRNTQICKMSFAWFFGRFPKDSPKILYLYHE